LPGAKKFAECKVGFAECKVAFAGCIRHPAKRLNPVVRKIRGREQALLLGCIVVCPVEKKGQFYLCGMTFFLEL